ncbi:MAG: benzoate-CoA ligase family protein [Candidatus Bathyarchaeia archaeon]
MSYSMDKSEQAEIEIPSRFNVATLLVDENVRKGRGEKVVYYYHHDDEARCRKVTYRELQSSVNKTGNVLKHVGVELENRVMLLQNDSPELVAGLLGAMKIGAVPFVANTLLTPEEYEYLLNDSRARVAIVDEEYVDKIEKIRDELRYLKNLIVIGEARGDQLSYYELLKESSTELEAVDLSKDEILLWQYSSGTTGPPKGIMHMQRNIMYSTETYYKRILGLHEKDVCFSASKIFFGFGQGNSVWAPLRWGASAVLYPGRPLPERVFEIIERYGVTILFSAPTHYNAMLQVKDAEKKYDLSSLRLCVSAGEALPPILYESWKKRFKTDVLDGIGCTEGFHIFISNRPGLVKPGSSGRPVPGYEARIVDEKFRDVSTGEIGNLLVKGGSIAFGYWGKYDKMKKAFLGEWLSTGDMYLKDEEGNYWHCGRSDDMIKSGGAWVSPVEVERTLMEHPAVLEAAAIPSYTPEGLQKVKGFVRLKSGYQPSPELAEELKAFVKSKIAPYKRPEWIEFVTELPKTATGKILRYKLRQLERERLSRIREELTKT